jgi:hypothetical protein
MAFWAVILFSHADKNRNRELSRKRVVGEHINRFKAIALLMTRISTAPVVAQRHP